MSKEEIKAALDLFDFGFPTKPMKVTMTSNDSNKVKAPTVEEILNNIDEIYEKHNGKHIKELNKVEQILGIALGYPWYKDDQKSFPGATEKDGVCVGEHTTVSLAMEAVEKIKKLEEQIATLKFGLGYKPGE